MASIPRLVLVDGSTLLFRAYYAIPANLQTSSGLPTNAIFGFATMFRKLFMGKDPTFGAVIFDAPGPNFREQEYAEYKKNRPSVPDDLIAQTAWIDKVVHAHAFALLRIPGYEADDVIGTLTQLGLDNHCDVTIISGDKDFAQLISDRVRMIDTMRDITFDVELVKKKWGVAPHQFVDYLALVGDKVDNIPGVAGIGAKGAAQLLEKYDNLDNIIKNIEELTGRTRNALTKHGQEAQLSKRLATIVKDVPLNVTLEDLRIPTKNNEKLNQLYTELEFFSLLEKEKKDASKKQNNETCQVIDINELMTQLAKPELQGVPITIFPISEEPRINPDSFIGMGFGLNQSHCYFVDLRNIAKPTQLLNWLQNDHPKATHNAKKLHFLLHNKYKIMAEGLIIDIQVISFLLDPAKRLPHTLDQLAKEFSQTALTPIKSLVGSGQNLRSLLDIEASQIADWCGEHIRAIDLTWPKLIKELRSQPDLLSAYEVIEAPLSKLLAKMENFGILVDPHKLKQVEDELQQRINNIEEEIYSISGETFNLASPKQLANILFEKLKLPVVKKTKTGYSTNAEVLERLAPKYPICELLLEHRKLTKLINTYTRVLCDALAPTTHRIHANYQQTVGVTGRLISTNPDLQRTPIKSKEGAQIREAFYAPDGWKIISADWSQIELRILAHYSQDPLLLESFQKSIDIHAQTACKLFDVSLDDVSKDQRRIAKTINFATIYGQGATALGHILGIKRKDAQDYITTYFSTYGYVRAWLDATIEQAKIDGYVSTIFGRRRYIPELFSKTSTLAAGGERIAANTPIQGSAADLCKQAMLNIDKELIKQQLKQKC